MPTMTVSETNQVNQFLNQHRAPLDRDVLEETHSCLHFDPRGEAALAPAVLLATYDQCADQMDEVSE